MPSATVIVPATSRSSAGDSAGVSDGSTDGSAGWVGSGAWEAGEPALVPHAATRIVVIVRRRRVRIWAVIGIGPSC